MTSIERSAVINASAEAIDDLLMDVTRVSEVWDANKAEPDEVWPAPGGKLVSSKKMGGMPMKTHFTMVEHTHGKSHIAKMKGAFDGTMKWNFEPQAEGTLFTIIMEYEVGGGAVGKALNKAIIEKTVTGEADKLVSSVKALAEQ